MAQGGCDLSAYGSFHKVVFDNSPDVQSSPPVVTELSAPNGANRLFIFSGTAMVDIRPPEDDRTWAGVVDVVLNLPLSTFVQVVDGACHAAFAGYANIAADTNTTFSIDCVDWLVQGIPGAVARPTVRAAVAIQGAAQNTRIVSIAYQANLQVFVGLDLQVSFNNPRFPPFFGKKALINSGDNWLGLVRLIVPAPSGGLTVTLKSLNLIDPQSPSVAPVPGSVVIPGGQMGGSFLAPNTTVFNLPPETDVPIVATLPGGIVSTALLQVSAKPA
jgi:hypothetical protein